MHMFFIGDYVKGFRELYRDVQSLGFTNMYISLYIYGYWGIWGLGLRLASTLASMVLKTVFSNTQCKVILVCIFDHITK